DATTKRLPADLTVVQVGDLIHRGPDSPGAIDLVRTVLRQQPGQWIQLAGNHEAQYITPPKFHWPERLPEDDLETLFEWWSSRRVREAAGAPVFEWCAPGRLRVATAAGAAGEPYPYLVTHAGLTEGFWRHFI